MAKSPKINFGKNSNEAEEDKVRGNSVGAPLEGLVKAKLVSMYLITSSTGNQGLALDFELTERGFNKREFMFFTSAKGCKKGELKTTYTDRKTGKERPLPTFSLLNSLTNILVGKSLEEVLSNLKEKKIQVYDFKKGKNVIRTELTYPKIIGKELHVGFHKVIEEKYNAKGEFLETSEITKFFGPDKHTRNELEQGKKAKFYKEWHENELKAEPQDKTYGAYKKSLKKKKSKGKGKKKKGSL